MKIKIVKIDSGILERARITHKPKTRSVFLSKKFTQKLESQRNARLIKAWRDVLFVFFVSAYASYLLYMLVQAIFIAVWR